MVSTASLSARRGVAGNGVTARKAVSVARNTPRG